MKLNGLESKTEFDMANMNDTEMRKTCNKLRGKDWAVVKIRIGDENSDLIKRDLRFTFEDKIARIDFEDLESFRKRLGRQIIKDKCGFQIAPNNMEKFKGFQIINLDREAQLTPLGKVLRIKTIFFCR